MWHRLKQHVILLGVPLCLFGLLDARANPTSRAQPAALPEYTVKSAYLYQIAHFIDWPAEGLPPKEQPFSLCILGEDPFGPLLEPLEEKAIKDRRISIMRIRRVREADRCQILFISQSERQGVDKILEELEHRSTLTVSDMDGFARAGGIIQFVRENNKVRFAINVEAASHAGLRISSKLLNLARVVKGASETDD